MFLSNVTMVTEVYTSISKVLKAFIDNCIKFLKSLGWLGECGCFTVAMTQDWWEHSDQWTDGGLIREKNVPQSSSWTFCRTSVLSWREVASSPTFLIPSHPPKSSPHCVCRCTHTRLLPFLSKLCILTVPWPHSWINFRRRPWCLLGFFGCPFD